VPSSRAIKAREQIEKVDFLKELGADRLILPDLPLAGLEHFSRRMTSRQARGTGADQGPASDNRGRLLPASDELRVTDAA